MLGFASDHQVGLLGFAYQVGFLGFESDHQVGLLGFAYQVCMLVLFASGVEMVSPAGCNSAFLLSTSI